MKNNNLGGLIFLYLILTTSIVAQNQDVFDKKCYYFIQNEEELISLLEKGIGLTTTSVISNKVYKTYTSEGFYGAYDMFDNVRECSSPFLGHMVTRVSGQVTNWKYTDQPDEVVSFTTTSSRIQLWNGIRVGITKSTVLEKLNDYDLLSIDRYRVFRDNIERIFILEFNDQQILKRFTLGKFENSNLTSSNIEDIINSLKN